MPRIIRNKEPVTISYSVFDRDETIGDVLEERDSRAAYPQPYRRVRKMVREIFEDAWEIIERNENHRLTELAKPRPPKYHNTSIIQDIDDFNCICPSTDENSDFLFVGSNGYISCVDTAAMSRVDKIDLTDEGTEHKSIVFIASTRIKSSLHLVVSISSTGALFLHLFSVNKFYPIDWVRESEQIRSDFLRPNLASSLHVSKDVDKKYIYRRCELASNGEIMALLVESRINPNDCQIEVYKFPRDQWAQFAESVSLLNSRKTTRSMVNLDPIQEAASSTTTGSVNLEPEGSILDSVPQQPQVPKPVLLCKIKPPVNLIRFQTTNTQNIGQILKATEPNDVIGTGANNVINKYSLDLKCQIAERTFNLQLMEESLSQLNATTDLSLKFDAKIKFLGQNRYLPLPAGAEQSPESLTGLGVCWFGSNQFQFYPFAKLTKEMESKVEYSIPFSAEIVQVEVTKCSTLIAFALKNNNIVVFDLNSGIERRVVHFDAAFPIKKIQFLPLIISNKSLHLPNQPQLVTESKIICLTDEGRIHSVDCSLGADEEPQVIFEPKLASKDDKLIEFIPCSHIPVLIMAVSENRKVFVLDLQRGKLLCELENDESKYKLGVMSNVQAAFGLRNELLFLKCSNLNDYRSSLICHSVRLVPILDDYFSISYQSLSNHQPLNAMLNDRIKNLLKARAEESSTRKERLKGIWSDLYQHKNI